MSLSEAPTSEGLKQSLGRAGLIRYLPVAETWEIEGSSRKLATLTHGVFRYFGKFPPPVAERLIRKYTECGDLVLDPAMGSGTTLVEAARLGRRSLGRDVLPLAILVSKVKTTPVEKDAVLEAVDAAVAKASTGWGRFGADVYPTMRGMSHWYWPPTASRLSALAEAISTVEATVEVVDSLRLVLATVSRRYSRSSHGLPRAFLEPAKTPESQGDLFDFFSSEADRVGTALDSLRFQDVWVQPQVECRDIRTTPQDPISARLAIFHPPYFNVYRYSSIYRFEGTWLRRLPEQGSEIREGFKQGKPELLPDYVSDVVAGIENTNLELIDGGKIALMIGDTEIRTEYVQTVRSVLEVLERRGWVIERLWVRVPRHTEASYKTAQRRVTDSLGPRFKDFVAVLAKPQ